MSARVPLGVVLGSVGFFHWARVPAYFGTLPRIRAALDPQPAERVLEVGCGTGMCTRVAPGPYVGIDTSLAYLRFAGRRARGGRASFAAMSADALAFRPDAFDKALIVNVLHHLPDAVVGTLLSDLRRLVRGPVVIVELAPELANPLEHFFIRHDRGEHIRRRAALAALVSRHYRVVDEELFHNAMRTAPQILLRLLP
jgi:SAM-dependent methyltransferase